MGTKRNPKLEENYFSHLRKRYFSYPDSYYEFIKEEIARYPLYKKNFDENLMISSLRTVNSAVRYITHVVVCRMTEFKEKQSLHTFNNQLKLLQQLKCLATEQSFTLEDIGYFYKRMFRRIYNFFNAEKRFSEIGFDLFDSDLTRMIKQNIPENEMPLYLQWLSEATRETIWFHLNDMANHFRYRLAARPKLIKKLNAIIPPPIEETLPIQAKSEKPKKTVRFFDEITTQSDTHQQEPNKNRQPHQHQTTNSKQTLI